MTDTPPPRHTDCAVCGTLHDHEYAMQKHGWEADDTSLPDAVGRLMTVRDLKPNSSRQLTVERCPACGTYYLYQTDYEYLAGGSEDEQRLTRLSDAAAAEYLNAPIQN